MNWVFSRARHLSEIPREGGYRYINTHIHVYACTVENLCTYRKLSRVVSSWCFPMNCGWFTRGSSKNRIFLSYFEMFWFWFFSFSTVFSFTHYYPLYQKLKAWSGKWVGLDVWESIRGWWSRRQEAEECQAGAGSRAGNYQGLTVI